MRDLGARERLPVFWFGPDAGVLPAFGRMTGLAMIKPAPSDARNCLPMFSDCYFISQNIRNVIQGSSSPPPESCAE